MGPWKYFPLSITFMVMITNVNSQVIELCKKTSYPAVCTATIKPGQDTIAATESAIQATLFQVKGAKVTVATLMNTPDHMRKADVKDSMDLYNNANHDLLIALRNLKSKNIADLEINLSAVITYAGTCNDGFTENPGGPLDKNVHQLASVGLASARQVKF